MNELYSNYLQVCTNMSNTTGVKCGSGSAYLRESPDITHPFPVLVGYVLFSL